jgi:hypothetical protein
MNLKMLLTFTRFTFCTVYTLSVQNIRNSALSMTDWPGESRWKLRSTSISVDGGRRLFKPWGNWDMNCVPFRGWTGKTKYLSVFELGGRCQAHWFECVKNCNAAGLFMLNSILCIKNGSPPKGHPATLTQLWEALESTWASIHVWNAFDNLHALTNWSCSGVKGGVQLNSRTVFLMFCTLGVRR